MKRLQVNVSKSVLQGWKESSRSVTKDDTKKQANAQRQSDDVNQSKIVQSHSDDDDGSVCDIMKFKSKVIEIMPNKVTPSDGILTAHKLKPFRSSEKTSSEKKSFGPSASVRMSAETPRIRSRSQHEYVDIETTLAKITSSQRAICTALPSLM